MSSNTSRRALLAGLAAAPVVALPALGAGEELPSLISAYSRAKNAFLAACDEEERMESAWKAANKGEPVVPIFLGGAISLKIGPEECRQWILRSYSHNRDALKPLSRIAPEQAEQIRQSLDAKEAENLALMDKLFNEEDERKEAFGLGPAKRLRQETRDAEEQAAFALCGYRCRNLEEARLKSSAILNEPCIMEVMDERHFEAFVSSFVSASALDEEA